MIRTITLPLLLLWATLAGAVSPMEFQSPAEEARFKALSEELRCLQCQNQTLADSNAAIAQDLRDEVLRLMREGLSDQQIKTYLADRYTDFVLYRPPVKPTTWALWFGPALLLLIAVAILVISIRRRARSSEVIADPDQEELDRRLERET